MQRFRRNIQRLLKLQKWQTTIGQFLQGLHIFFKIILQETLQENKLRIPQKFVRKFGETLSNVVLIKLPCGSEWKMRLLKHDDGKVWFKMGWPEFVKHYSIQRGDLLIFRYKGNSKFSAAICDRTTVEIDYPCIPAHAHESNTDSKLLVPQGDLVKDGFVEILDDSLPCQKRAEKTPLTNLQPRKRTRTSPTDKAHTKLEASETVLDRPKSERDLKNGSPDMKGKHNWGAENDIAEPIIRRQGRSETIRGTKPIEGTERTTALQKASGFKSKHPFVKVQIKSSSSTTLTLPAKFSRKHLKNKSNVVLKVPGGRTWPVKYSFEAHNGSSIAKFCFGWKAFARKNNLGVGDVCVFVLRNHVKILFEVEIFRDSGSSKAPISPREKARILQRTPFESQKPFFMIVIQPTYIGASKGSQRYVNVPRCFARRYIKDYEGNVLLVSKARSWPAQLCTSFEKKGKSTRIASAGWRAFVEDNNLQVRDVCAFELLDRVEFSFKVSIFRNADYDANRRRSQAGGSLTCGGEPNGDAGDESESD